MHTLSTRSAAVALLSAILITGCGGGGSQSSDPTVQDFRVAYVSRPVPRDNNGNLQQLDIRRPDAFNPGAALMVRDRASANAAERNVTERAFPGQLYDVKDVEANYDGTKFVFAMRAPEIQGADDRDQPAWNIWEYSIADDKLTQLTSISTALEGHNIAPHYLPDGEKIVFSSTQQVRTKAINVDDGKGLYRALDEDRRTHAFQLHVLDPDNPDVVGDPVSLTQISFNQSHDLDPTVLPSGRILFSRWDGAGPRSEINLYTINPDGTDLQLYYGAHSHNTGTNNSTIQFMQPRVAPNGQILSIIQPFSSSGYGGAPIYIDGTNYTDVFQQNGVGQVTSSAQSTAAGIDVRTDGQPSPGGRYSSVFPLDDGTNRFLVSWSQCRLIENNVIVACSPTSLAAPNPVEAPPLYGIWIYNPGSNTQLPVVLPKEEVIYTDVVAAHPRTKPVVLADTPVDTALHSEGAGVLHIRSVYDIGGAYDDRDTATPDKTISALADPAQTLADARSARFLRVVKGVSIPDDDDRDFVNAAFGPQVNQLMREIVGYAPVEPDGSVKIKVPADVPLAIDVLDKDGRRIGGRHENWIQVRPGETRTCNGCHTANSEVAHGRPGAEFPSLNTGSTSTGVPFPNTLATLWTDFGETMAETRTRHDPAAMNPSADLIYADVWTDPSVRTPDTGFSRTYAALDATIHSALLPSSRPSAKCAAPWSNLCRVIINYETHIHPIWSYVRPNPADTCTSCHSPVDSMANPRVPLGQLDLTDDGPNDNDARFRAYRELLIVNNAQALDPMTNQLVAAGTVPVTMSANGANSSNAFFNLFAAGGTHDGRLTPDELRLLSEWVDIGAQYYNNPFDAPTN